MDDLIQSMREAACDTTDEDACYLLREAAYALEAARADAERYRWLRDDVQTNRAPHIYQYPAQSFDNPKLPHFKDVGIDAAIDAAREQETKK